MELLSLLVYGLHSLLECGLLSLLVYGLHSLLECGLLSLLVYGLHSLLECGLLSLLVYGLHSLLVCGLLSLLVCGLLSPCVWMHTSFFQGRSSRASSFHASLLQAIDGVKYLVLCPQIVSQAPQHFRSSETQATCDGCFVRQSVCSVISLHSGMSRAVYPQEFSFRRWLSTLDTFKSGRPIPLFTFCSKLIESARMGDGIMAFWHQQ